MKHTFCKVITLYCFGLIVSRVLGDTNEVVGPEKDAKIEAADIIFHRSKRDEMHRNKRQDPTDPDGCCNPGMPPPGGSGS